MKVRQPPVIVKSLGQIMCNVLRIQSQSTPSDCQLNWNCEEKHSGHWTQAWRFVGQYTVFHAALGSIIKAAVSMLCPLVEGPLGQYVFGHFTS